jgi:hypothetical protein
MPEMIKHKFTVKAITSTTCTLNSSHNSCREVKHSVFPVCTDDVLPGHILCNGSDFDILQVIEHKMTLNNVSLPRKCSYIIQSETDTYTDSDGSDSDCVAIGNPNACKANIHESTTVINNPDVFFVSYTNNQNQKFSPSLTGSRSPPCTIQVNTNTYLA